MCWSGEASGVLAAAGLTTAVYVAYKGESKELWIPLTYFALMELLQAVTYIYIDLCGNPNNQLLTLLGYLHIAFQPFFVNMVAMYFIPESVKLKIRTTVYSLCAISTLAMLIKMYPFVWAAILRAGRRRFLRPETCSVSGEWHIAWNMPLNGLMSNPVSWLLGFNWGLHAFSYILASFYAGYLWVLAVCWVSLFDRSLDFRCHHQRSQ